MKWLENNFGSLKAQEGEDYHEDHLDCRHKSSIRSLGDSYQIGGYHGSHKPQAICFSD